jgi:hypothetical protein
VEVFADLVAGGVGAGVWVLAIAMRAIADAPALARGGIRNNEWTDDER